MVGVVGGPTRFEIERPRGYVGSIPAHGVAAIEYMSKSENLGDTFREALKEEGLSDVEVNHYHEVSRMADVFEVRKYAGDEKLGVKKTITDQERVQINDIDQHIAYLASDVARSFESYLTERVEWGENCVQLDLTEEYTATCFRCGSESSLDELRRGPVGMAEAAVPNPPVNNLDALPDLKKRMTLLALLRDECENWCPNSPAENFKYL